MRLSYSSINTYETCPAKFKFQYEDRLPQARSPALAFGESLHRALHLFHDRPVPVAPSLEELHDMLEAGWVSEGFVDDSEERTYYDHGRQVLAQYHVENADRYRIPAALEFHHRDPGAKAFALSTFSGPRARLDEEIRFEIRSDACARGRVGGGVGLGDGTLRGAAAATAAPTSFLIWPPPPCPPQPPEV